jgi:hypothetical protein
MVRETPRREGNRAVTRPTMFALLESEWTELAPTPVPAGWRQDAALASHRTLADLVAVTERRGDPAGSDRVLAALARRASDTQADALAARTLLQMLLPGAKALARRLQWLGDAGERAADVIACLYEQIRTYPYQRRPARIAANLLCDTRQRLLRAAFASRAGAARGGQPVEVSIESLAEQGVPLEPPAADPSSGEELLALLSWAVRCGHLTGAQARLIGQSRIAGSSCEELGAAAGLGAHSLRRRRQRAEHALREAARVGGAPAVPLPPPGRVPEAACA